MDAVKFIEERNRMCGTMSEVWGVDAAQIVKNTEEWAAAHPRKTRQSVFLEQFPNVRFDINGIIDISPCQVDQEQYPLNGKDRCRFQSCFDCRREFWMQEVE